MQSYPKGYYLTDALYYLSDCYLRSGERGEAIETLTALADRGTTQYTVAVLEKLSEMTYADERSGRGRLGLPPALRRRADQNRPRRP